MTILSEKLTALERVYRIFDAAVTPFPLACKENCPDCCTCNVVVTGLEAAWMFSRLDTEGIERLRTKIDRSGTGKRYRPEFTTNGFARACMEGRNTGGEENDPAWGECPLLEDGRCTVYDARPFGCRSMISEAVCRNAGYAQMPPLALTISNVIQQYIEHMDAGGISGNLTDMLGLYLETGGPGGERGNVPPYLALENPEEFDKTKRFIRNRKIPALMIPPEHRSQMPPILEKLSACTVTDAGAAGATPAPA
ncbi:MAG: hypothetical protein V6Z89_12690 [Desulfobacter sp.]